MTTTQLLYHRLTLLTTVGCLLTAGASASAQPPATPPQAPAAEAADAAIEPPPPTLDDFSRRDPAVAAALELPRETAAQKLRTVLVLIDLGQVEAAALALPELLETDLDDAGRAALVAKFGSARFFELMRLDPVASDAAAEAPVAPLAGARAFAESCLDAAAKLGRDPQRLAQLIEQLQSPNEEDRHAARVDLRAAGDPGIVACFTALAAAKTPEARANLLLALADLHPAVDEPLLAVLDGAHGQLRRDAVELAGHLKLGAALPWLAVIAATPADAEVAAAAQTALAGLGVPTPAPGEAQALVLRRLNALESLPAPAMNDLPNTWWSWNPETNELVATEFSASQVRTLDAARLARLLAEAGGALDAASPRRAVIRALEEIALLGREPSAALQQSLAAMSPAEVSVTLRDAVAEEHFAAATILAAELGRRGDDSVLATADGLPSPLAAALFSPVRALRFAALSAVIQIEPPHRFPGSSGVTDALWYFAAGAGDPATIAAAPVYTRASHWAGQLRGLGFEATPAATGRDALAAVLNPATSPRLALVVLDSDIGQPLLRETMYQLRASDRTARVPVLIAASAPHLAYAHRVAEDFPFTDAAPRPRSDAAMSELVDRTLAIADEPLPEAAVRTSQAAQALSWIAKSLAASAPYDELRRDAALVELTLFVPELTAPSLEVLAALGTAESQSLLADYASARTAPVEARRLAAAALAANLQQFGTQLTLAELQRQYDRYNASASADADTQQVLGGILDALEKKPLTP